MITLFEMVRFAFLSIIIIMFHASNAQTSGEFVDVNISLNYPVPDFEPAFRESFDGRPSLRLRVRQYTENKLSYAFSGEILKVKGITSSTSLGGAKKATFYTINGILAYNILRDEKIRIEPGLAGGYNFISYNDFNSTADAFSLSPELAVFLATGTTYGFEFALSYYTLFEQFSPDGISTNINRMRLIILRIGITFQTRSKKN